MIGSIFPSPLTFVRFRSTTFVHQILALNKKSGVKQLGECSQISSTHAAFTIVSNGFGGGVGDGDSDPIKTFIRKYVSWLQRLGFSGVLGACSGVALKRVSREAATIVGVVFVGLQALSYYNYIHIDYESFTGDTNKALDVNRDGNFDENDAANAFWDKIKETIAFNLPNAASFSVGFVVGVRLS